MELEQKETNKFLEKHNFTRMKSFGSVDKYHYAMYDDLAGDNMGIESYENNDLDIVICFIRNNKNQFLITTASFGIFDKKLLSFCEFKELIINEIRSQVRIKTKNLQNIIDKYFLI